MSVLFYNQEVPVWKLRIGTVIGCEVLSHIDYGHIQGILVNKKGELSLQISFGTKQSVVSPSKLLWLEPT